MQLSQRAMLVIFLSCSFASAHDIESKVQYLGNEAVHFSHGAKSVLFDAFYSNDHGQYQLLEENTKDALLAAESPYDNVSLVFVSHIHGDHFSPGPTLDYLRQHPNVHLLAPGQVIDAVLQNGGVDINTQLRRVDLSPGERPISISIEGFSVAVAAIPHSGGPRNQDIENLVFRVAIGDGTTVAHFGDSVAEQRWFKPLKNFFQPVDVAFVPFWFYSGPAGREIISDFISAKHTIGFHVPAKWRGAGPEYRKRVQGDLFTDPGEFRIFKGDTGELTALPR